MPYKLCNDCGQPMLPKGEKKRSGEYDHASGCPQVIKRSRAKRSRCHFESCEGTPAHPCPMVGAAQGMSESATLVWAYIQAYPNFEVKRKPAFREMFPTKWEELGYLKAQAAKNGQEIKALKEKLAAYAGLKRRGWMPWVVAIKDKRDKLLMGPAPGLSASTRKRAALWRKHYPGETLVLVPIFAASPMRKAR